MHPKPKIQMFGMLRKRKSQFCQTVATARTHLNYTTQILFLSRNFFTFFVASMKFQSKIISIHSIFYNVSFAKAIDDIHTFLYEIDGL